MPTWPTITDGVTRLSTALFGLIKTYIDDSLTGQGLPAGGTTNDILYKTSATNYAAAWTDAPTLDAVTLDTAAAEATGIAKLYWDATEGTAMLGLGGGNVTLRLGKQEMVIVANRTGSALTIGQVVYVLGAHGDRPEVALADASSEATSARTLGIVAETIADASTGLVCVSGLLRGLNTNTLTEGAAVWLSETTGAMTTTRPTQPAQGVFLGVCVKQGPGGSGILYVSVINGQELEELHDVLISAPAAGDLLKRNPGNTLWVNSAPAALTKTDDTNVTLTLGGSPTTALVNAASITAGWTGTLASTRLNSNVVQSVVNDTNVTGAIAAQALTLGWTGQLGIARGGTGASTQQAAINALAGAVTSAQYLRGNGTNVVMSAIQAADVPTLNQNTTGSAATLTTARNINGTAFNGSAAITTASWGTARTLTIGNTGKSVDGSANVSWSIAEVGALALTGGTLTGNITSATGMVAWNTTTPGTTTGNIQIGTASGTANSGGAITFAARDGASGTNAQAGIYVVSDGSFGTRMYLATTDSYVTGARTALSISEGGVVNFVRSRPTYSGNTILDAANYNSYAVAGAGYSTNQNLNTSNGPTFANVYNNGWFRNNGATGLYNETYGRGIIESQAGGASYGNMITYNTGYNGWSGWGIGTTMFFMGRPGVRDWGIFDTTRSWAIYQNPSAHGGVSIGGSSPLSSYTLRIEGNVYTNSTNHAYAFYGHSNVAGTGNAIYCPSGVYSTGTNWLYGTMYLNSNSIWEVGSIYLTSGLSGGVFCSNQWAFYYDYPGNRFGCFSTTTVAGYGYTFNTSLYVNGSIVVTGSKSFVIAHPVDETKQLVYAAIEGPRIDVLHRGVGTVIGGHSVLNLDTEAGLLPGTCAKLMRDLQCQVTNIDDHFCQIRAHLDGAYLHIYTDTSTPTRISWIVLGERQDAEIRAAQATDDEGRLITQPDRFERTEGEAIYGR